MGRNIQAGRQSMRYAELSKLELVYTLERGPNLRDNVLKSNTRNWRNDDVIPANQTNILQNFPERTNSWVVQVIYQALALGDSAGGM